MSARVTRGLAGTLARVSQRASVVATPAATTRAGIKARAGVVATARAACDATARSENAPLAFGRAVRRAGPPRRRTPRTADPDDDRVVDLDREEFPTSRPGHPPRGRHLLAHVAGGARHDRHLDQAAGVVGAVP